jgi:hypothetical protein
LAGVVGAAGRLRVVAGSGRQDLVAEVKRWDEDEARERMLGQQAA